jgi:hypothetical protein
LAQCRCEDASDAIISAPRDHMYAKGRSSSSAAAATARRSGAGCI